MPVLNANNLSKRFGERAILDGVGLAIEAGERVGLVGINGSGKTTLAKILAGLEDADTGEVVFARDVRPAYLEQQPRLDEDATASEIVLAGLTRWSAAVARHHEVSAALQAQDGDEQALQSLLVQQADAAAAVERLGGWDLRHQASAMLGHLGIAEPDQRVATMSGGERRRVALARLLIARPAFAILDEPTNHLDIDTIEWLEQFLSERFTGAMLLITHDRYLLDRVVTRTLEMDSGALYSYEGGWERYLVAKAQRQAHAERVERNRRNILKRELDWLRRQPKARTTKSKSRVDRVNELVESSTRDRGRDAKIRVEAIRSGHTVLDVNELDVAIAGRTLVEGFNLCLGKGERIGIVGRNGCGKTTLLRALLGELEPIAGAVRLGKNTRVAYLDQARSGLDDKDTVYDSVAEGRSTIRVGGNDVSVHSYLERFLFRPTAQKQKISTLSGGERARVALARILRDQANLVVLDEPTNDLDVTTLSAVEESLLGFPGTVLVVTHDRWFLDRVATSIIAFEADDGYKLGQRVVHVHGNFQSYDAYRQQQRRNRAVALVDDKRAAKPPPRPAPDDRSDTRRRGLTYGEQIELDGLLERIDGAETAVAELEAEMAADTFYQRDHTEQAAFFERLKAAKVEAETLVERWAELESRREDA